MTDDPYIWLAAILCLLFSIGILWLGVEIATAPFLDEPDDDLANRSNATSTTPPAAGLGDGRRIEHTTGE